MPNDQTAALVSQSASIAYGRGPDVVATPLPGELILLDPGTGEMYSLNPTGQFVWERLGDAPLEELVDEFAAQYGVTRERARGDVASLISDLSARGLIEPTRAVRE